MKEDCQKWTEGHLRSSFPFSPSYSDGGGVGGTPAVASYIGEGDLSNSPFGCRSLYGSDIAVLYSCAIISGTRSGCHGLVPNENDLSFTRLQGSNNRTLF